MALYGRHGFTQMISGLMQWEEMFKSLLKCPVDSLLAFVYPINDQAYIRDFQTVYKRNGKTYGTKGIKITDFEKNKVVRSGFGTEKQVWQIPRHEAKKILKDFDSFL